MSERGPVISWPTNLKRNTLRVAVNQRDGQGNHSVLSKDASSVMRSTYEIHYTNAGHI